MNPNKLNDLLQKLGERYPNTLGRCLNQAVTEQWEYPKYISWLKDLQGQRFVKELNNINF